MLKKKSDKRKHVKTIAVASGKGGVGKTNVVANLAIAVKRLGKDVMILDGDLGLSNIDVLLHLAPRQNIQNLLSGEMGLRDVVVEGPHGIKILPASSGVQELTSLDEFQRLRILEAFDRYEENVDVLLIDTAAGISENVAFFCIAAQEIIIVASPEPTAITDAYALMKVLFTRYQEKEFNILVNSVRNSGEAMEVFRRLSLAAEKFLNISLNYLGYIPFDETVRKAVSSQKAFVDVYPDGPASLQVTEIASKILDPRSKVKGTLQFFIGNLLSASSV
ncbi:MAG TPA: MinD/ParA family protein [Thermodesulfovibrionales bacterium]|nr:MinD/ParA family protein [Thermodesulfovibrionales bacterium]